MNAVGQRQNEFQNMFSWPYLYGNVRTALQNARTHEYVVVWVMVQYEWITIKLIFECVVVWVVVQFEKITTNFIESAIILPKSLERSTREIRTQQNQVKHEHMVYKAILKCIRANRNRIWKQSLRTTRISLSLNHFTDFPNGGDYCCSSKGAVNF